jgi:hypothetical protein
MKNEDYYIGKIVILKFLGKNKFSLEFKNLQIVKLGVNVF